MPDATTTTAAPLRFIAVSRTAYNVSLHAIECPGATYRPHAIVEAVSLSDATAQAAALGAARPESVTVYVCSCAREQARDHARALTRATLPNPFA